MFDQKLYREACRELRAPEDKIEEIIAMTEKTNKKRIRPLRTALIAAAAVAMMVVSVAAANPEEFHAFVVNLGSIVRVDRYRSDVTTEDGETFSMLSVPNAKLENRDGRAILTLNGEDAADITDALVRDRHYVFEDFSEDTKVTVTVDGSIDKWTIEAAIGVVKEDGTYEEFGSVTGSSENQGDIDGQFFAYDPDSLRGEEAPYAEVVTGTCVSSSVYSTEKGVVVSED